MHKLTQTKSEYFLNLNIKDLNDNKKFWKKLNLFWDKYLETNYIILKEKSELITNSSTLAPPKFPSIPNLLIHYRYEMSIKNK